MSKLNDEEKDEVSGPLVMRSPAGYYVGLEYLDKEIGAWLPYDRLTGYFKHEYQAKKELATFKSTKNE